MKKPIKRFSRKSKQHLDANLPLGVPVAGCFVPGQDSRLRGCDLRTKKRLIDTLDKIIATHRDPPVRVETVTALETIGSSNAPSALMVRFAYYSLEGVMFLFQSLLLFAILQRCSKCCRYVPAMFRFSILITVGGMSQLTIATLSA